MIWNFSKYGCNLLNCFFFFLIFSIYLAVSGLCCDTGDLQSSLGQAKSSCCSSQSLFSCGTRDLAPPPGIKPRPPAWGAQGLNHWTARESPSVVKWETPNSSDSEHCRHDRRDVDTGTFSHSFSTQEILICLRRIKVLSSLKAEAVLNDVFKLW